jgi:tRNA (guanosine-2'-O-)-methyltransferase
MLTSRSEKRTAKITRAVGNRQPDLVVVMENIHDPHNVSAIIRTCDAIGVGEVYLIYYIEKSPKIGKKSSASAWKWVKRKNFKTVDDCYSELRDNGYKIYATCLEGKSKSLWDVDFTGKVAIVLGNEHRGVSEEAWKKADGNIQIPMFGMIQSLNVSVASAVILYEIARQRYKAGHYENPKFSEEKYDKILNEWLNK